MSTGSSAPPEYQFPPDERAAFPGSPHTPKQPLARRLGYALVALVIGVCATLGNGLVSVNLNSLAGSLGVYSAEAGWLSAVYVAFNATANLTLIKARAQFGIPLVTRVLLAVYAGCALLQLGAAGSGNAFALALLIRAASGMAAAGLTTLTVYNMMQAFPAKVRPAALAAGIVIPQLGPPLARQFSVEMLALSSWQGLYLIELAVALTALLALTILPLPPSVRSKSFEPLDFLAILLLLPAMILVCGVLALGRALWWTDTPWLGWAIAAAVTLLATAVAIERSRRRPLLRIDWITSADILRFAAVALLVRLALAEQTFGAVGLLAGSGLNNDQLHTLFALVAAAMALGALTALLTLSVGRLPYQVMAAACVIALGAWLDSGASSLTGPEQLYLSQALLGFGTALFMGPALVYGVGKMIQRGPAFLVSFVVLFSITQNIGGLAGSALLGSVQVIASKAHLQALASHLPAGDPQVAARLQAGAGGLSQALARESGIAAYNDVFALVAALALLTAAYIAYLIIFNALRRRRASMEK
jgi:MFS family permease